jgi:ATP-dependent Clp protease ATP-binding subunit ClpB
MKILDGSVMHGDHVVVDAGADGLAFKVRREVVAT